MQNWAADYVRRFPTPEAKAIEIARLKAETKRADKRTRNGKMTRVFNDASILALDYFNLETGRYDIPRKEA